MKTDIYELLTDKEIYNLALQGDEVCRCILNHIALYKAFKTGNNEHSKASIYKSLFKKYKDL